MYPEGMFSFFFYFYPVFFRSLLFIFFLLKQKVIKRRKFVGHYITECTETERLTLYMLCVVCTYSIAL